MVVNRFCRSSGLRHIVPVLGRRLRWRGLIEWPRPSRTDSRPAVSVNVPTDTATHDIPEHFCLILERVVLVPE